MVKHSCKLDGLRLPLADVEVRGRGHDCMRFLTNRSREVWKECGSYLPL